MPDIKISELANASAIDGNELVELVQGGGNVKAAINLIKTFLNIPKRYNALIGNGSSVQFDIAHNLNTRNLHVTVYRTAAPYDEIITESQRLSVNSLRILGFASAPATNEYTVVISE